MKKFLLFALVAAATLNASAIERVKKSPFPKKQKMSLTQQSSVARLASQKVTYQLPEVQTPKKNISFLKKVDPSTLDLKPAFSEGTYRYSSVGGWLQQAILEGVSFQVTEDKVYLKPYKDIDGVIEGVFVDKENQYSSIGADSVTFNCGEAFAYYYEDPSDPTTLRNVYFEPCDEDEQYVPFRAGEKTFGAYYLAEYNELYIPGDLALFEESETTVMDETDVFGGMDLSPREDYEDNMYKATVSAKSCYGSEYDYESEDAAVFFGDGYLFIKGLLADFFPNAWLLLEADEEVENQYNIKAFQYIFSGNLYKDQTRTETYKAAFYTMGLLQKDGKLTGLTEDYSCSFAWTDNIDETASIQSTGGTVLGSFQAASEEEYMGYWNAVDLNITVLNEPYALGVTSVKSNAPQNNVRYNLAGQRVDKNYKGVVIENGKKFIKK